MRLPSQSPPVIRNAAHVARQTALPTHQGIAPSACPNPDTTPLGTCYDANGPIGPGNNMNCSACCALRGAIHWQGGGQVYLC